MTTMSNTTKTTERQSGEASFTLIETVIALAIVAFLIVEVAAVQGNAIVFSDYGRNVTEATWRARRVLSQVEYFWRSKPFKELITHQVDQKFEDSTEYTYSLEIVEWKFPFAKLLEMAVGGGKKKHDSDGNDLDKRSSKVDTGANDMIESAIKQIFGDEPIFLTAHVDVSWPEGAQRNSTGLTYLLTNQAKISEAITQLKPVYDAWVKKNAAAGKPKPGTPGTANAPNGAPPPPAGQDPNGLPDVNSGLPPDIPQPVEDPNAANIRDGHPDGT